MDKSIQGVIFDFNGTLFWDTLYHKEAFDIFLARYGKKLSRDEMTVKILGQSNDRIMEVIFERSLTKEEVQRYALEKELIYQDLCKDKLCFAPGAEDLFRYLKRQNIPFTIGSSVGVENVDFYYKYMDLGKWFPRERIVYNDGTFRGKPAPDIFLAAAIKLGVRPQDTAIFEDSPAGLQAAAAAGAGQIFAVNSAGDDYSRFPYPVITDFRQLIPAEN